MLRARLIRYASLALLALAYQMTNQTIFAAPADLSPLQLAASSIDPDWPAGLGEPDTKPQPASPTEPHRDQPHKPPDSEPEDAGEPARPAARQYEAIPGNTADPDWPLNLGTAQDKPDRHRSTPGEDASNRGPSSADPDWTGN